MMLNHIYSYDEIQIIKHFDIYSLPTAKILFSNVSNGTGLPLWSINFHSPVTPIAVDFPVNFLFLSSITS